MDEENKSQQESAAGTIRAAAKTGKTISSIAKGAATGGMHGAALGAAKSSKKWIIGIVAVAILLPVIILAMLPPSFLGASLVMAPIPQTELPMMQRLQRI